MLLLVAVWTLFVGGTRYHRGMTLAEVQILTSNRYPVQKLGVEYAGPMTDRQKEEDAVAYIYDERSGILLLFNFRDKLVETKRIKILGLDLFRTADKLRMHR